MAITNKVLEFILELTPGGIPPIIHASQGDVGRTFKANVVWNGSAASAYISGTTVNLRGKKPDKTVFDYTATVDGSSVTFATTEQMTIISGPVECELVFFENSNVVATANFILVVEESPFDPNAISESEIDGLNAMIQAATPEAVADWFETEATSSTVFADAVGGAVADYVEENGVGFTLKVDYKTRPGYIAADGIHSGAGAETQEVYTNKLPCFSGDTVTYSFVWESTAAKWGAVGFFDKNGRFLSRSSAFFSGTATSYTGTFTIPANAYYYAVTWRTYGDCTADFSYNGSVYDIRNRIDKALVSEDLHDEWDCGTLNTEYYQNGEEVVCLGPRPYTGFIKVPQSRKIVIAKNASYTPVLKAKITSYDNNRRLIHNTGLYEITETGTLFYIYSAAVYIKISFDEGSERNNYNYTPTPDTVKENVAIITEFDELPLTPIIGGSGIYPTFDTTNNTLTMPDDCIFFKNGRSIIAKYGQKVVDLSSVSSSAKKVYYNFDTHEYEVAAYSDITINQTFSTTSRVLVCTLRWKLGTHPNAVCINGPYILDGKLYGIDTVAEADFDAIAWAFNENVKGVNHRGYNTAPENTLPAYKLSKQVGFTYCETDVSMTSDRVPVLLHDDTINRTARNADGTEISSTINIGSITYEQALTYDFGIYKGAQYAGTKIPTFAQFIKLCKNLGLHPYIELKSGGGYTQAEVENLVDIVELYGMQGKVTWISFSASLLEYVKNYDASARLGFIVGAATSANVTTASGLKTANNDVFLDVSSISSSIVGECASANIPVEIWTVNSASTIEGLDPYISGVTSDSLIAAKVLYEANI